MLLHGAVSYSYGFINETRPFGRLCSPVGGAPVKELAPHPEISTRLYFSIPTLYTLPSVSVRLGLIQVAR